MLSEGGAHRFCATYATKICEKFRMKLSQNRFRRFGTRRKSRKRTRRDRAQCPELTSIARNICATSKNHRTQCTQLRGGFAQILRQNRAKSSARNSWKNFHKFRRTCAATTRVGQEHHKILRKHLRGSRCCPKAARIDFAQRMQRKFAKNFA